MFEPNQDPDRDPQQPDDLGEIDFPTRSNEAIENALDALDFAEQDCFAFIAMLPARPETISVEDISSLCRIHTDVDGAALAKKLVSLGLLVPCDEEYVLPPEVKAFASRMF